MTEHSTDLEGARRHIATLYPALADRMEQGTIEMLPMKDVC
jgi:hypothetical protein